MPKDQFVPEPNDADPMLNFVPGLPFDLMGLFNHENPEMRLPGKRFTEILSEVLVKDKIDVLCRLNPHAIHPFKASIGARTQLSHRFYGGDNGRCSINGAYDPNVVLAPLGVNKLWLEVGAAIFYGINVF